MGIGRLGISGKTGMLQRARMGPGPGQRVREGSFHATITFRTNGDHESNPLESSVQREQRAGPRP